MIFFYAGYFLLCGTTLVAVDNDNASPPISCITTQKKLFVFSDQFVELSRVLSDMKKDKCATIPFDFPHSWNVLKKVWQDLLDKKAINPTSIEKCSIAHKLELPLQRKNMFEKLRICDTSRFFSYSPYELAILTVMLKDNKKLQVGYSFELERLQKPKWKIFEKKVYITSTGVQFQPVLIEEESRFFLKKYTLGKRGFKNIPVSLLNYFLLDDYSLDYYLSQNKYYFLVMEFSEILRSLYIHFYDSSDHALTVRTIYQPKIKCEYDKVRKIVYIIRAQPTTDLKNYRFILERYHLPAQSGLFVDMKNIPADVLFNDVFIGKDFRFNEMFEFKVDMTDGFAYLSCLQDNNWLLYAYSPNKINDKCYQFNCVPCIATMNNGSIIRTDYDEGEVIISKFNLKSNSIDELLLENIDVNAHFYLSHSGKFALVLMRNEQEHMQMNLYDVHSGMCIDTFMFNCLLHTVNFRGDSSLVIKYFRPNGDKIVYIFDLTGIEQHLDFARALTAEDIIQHYKNSRYNKLRH